MTQQPACQLLHLLLKMAAYFQAVRWPLASLVTWAYIVPAG